MDELKITNQLLVEYLEITLDPTNDNNQLYQQYKKGFNIFISALSSNDCEYLLDLFFIHHPSTTHLNSYSTAFDILSSQLIRVLPPDNLAAKLFVKLAQEISNDIIIVYSSGSVWSTGLINY